jgi:hypothetical protein
MKPETVGLIGMIVMMLIITAFVVGMLEYMQYETGMKGEVSCFARDMTEDKDCEYKTKCF